MKKRGQGYGHGVGFVGPLKGQRSRKEEGQSLLDLLFLSPDTVRKNMARMVDISLARGVTPILGTITPDSRGGKPISQTNALLRELATQKKIALADLYAAVKDSWSSLTADGLHPNSAGYSKIAQVWTSAMDEADKMNAPPTANLTPILMLLLDE